jgi:hypothetical protein
MCSIGCGVDSESSLASGMSVGERNGSDGIGRMGGRARARGGKSADADVFASCFAR